MNLEECEWCHRKMKRLPFMDATDKIHLYCCEDCMKYDMAWRRIVKKSRETSYGTNHELELHRDILSRAILGKLDYRFAVGAYMSIGDLIEKQDQI